MRIAIIGSRGIPPKYSGIESSVDETSKRLGEKGHEITVYCRRCRDGKVRGEIYKNVRLVYIPTFNSKHFGTFIHVFFSTFHAIFTNAEIVHFHALGPSVFSILPRLCGKKTIVTIHSLDWKRRKWKYFARLFLRLCEYPAIIFPNRTTVVSKTLQGYFESKFKRKVYRIANGVNISRERTEENGLTSNEQYFLYAGRLVPEKGVHYLIKAFNEITTDMKLRIAGKANFTDGYMSELRYISGDNVDFKGFIEPKDLRQLYRDAYLFVLPSEVEGTSVSLLEAMSYGKCVVVSDIPECLEVIGDCGVTFKKADYLDLKAKLRYLIDHPEIVLQLGKKAKERVAEEYNWETIIDKLEGLYHSALYLK